MSKRKVKGKAVGVLVDLCLILQDHYRSDTVTGKVELTPEKAREIVKSIENLIAL